MDEHPNIQTSFGHSWDVQQGYRLFTYSHLCSIIVNDNGYSNDSF